MTDWVNVHNEKTGATALVPKAAVDKVYAAKGWKEVKPDEAAKLTQKRVEEINKAKQEAAEEAADTAVAEQAAAGVAPPKTDKK